MQVSMPAIGQIATHQALIIPAIDHIAEQQAPEQVVDQLTTDQYEEVIAPVVVRNAIIRGAIKSGIFAGARFGNVVGRNKLKEIVRNAVNAGVTTGIELSINAIDQTKLLDIIHAAIIGSISAATNYFTEQQAPGQNDNPSLDHVAEQQAHGQVTEQLSPEQYDAEVMAVANAIVRAATQAGIYAGILFGGNVADQNDLEEIIRNAVNAGVESSIGLGRNAIDQDKLLDLIHATIIGSISAAIPIV